MNLHSAIQIYGEFHEFKPFRAILVPAVGNRLAQSMSARYASIAWPSGNKFPLRLRS
jgi:hypothetical protein